MKTLSLSASAELAKRLGAAPTILVQIEIPNNFVHVAYYDIVRDNITWAGKIRNLGTINSEKRTDLVGSVSSVEITLDDSDEAYRIRLNSERWCGQKIKILHSFDALNETFLVFAGKVSTPFNWKEEDRSFSFEAVSNFTSLQAGIEVLEETFDGGISGSAVPLAFGTIVNACPIKIYENVNAAVVTPFTRVDSLLAIPETTVYPFGSWAQSPFQQQYGNYLYKSNGQYVVQTTTYSGSFEVDSSIKFPQQTPISLTVSNFIGKIEGSFNGNVFTVTKIVDLLHTISQANIVEQNVKGVRPSYIVVNDSFDYTYSTLVFRTTNTFGEAVEVPIYVLSQEDQKIFLSDDIPDNWSSIEVRVTRFYPSPTLFMPVRTIIVEVGAKVFLDDNGIVEAFAFTAMPYTNLKLIGQQIINGKRNLREVPQEFYNIDTNFKGLGISAITISRPFNSYKVNVQAANFELHWDDSFYVSFESTVGSNVSDIIKYVVQTYTNFEIDIASFEAVRVLVDKYPANFMVRSAPDALELISEICYQSRCGITIKDGIVYLKYLSIEPPMTAQISDDEIVEASFEISFTDESQVKTSLTAKFEKDCVDHFIKKQVYRNNVDIYGLVKEEKSYYIYNLDSLVKKSNDFWGFRISNQWKLITFKTFLTTLAVEQGDCIQVNSDLYTGKAIVDIINYDTVSNQVTYKLWTPVLIGTNVQSPLAWAVDTADVKPVAPIIYAQPADAYTINLPVSDYGVHDPSSLTGQITSNEDANGLASFISTDGTTGVASNLNPASKVKVGDKVILVKDKFNKFSMQASGGGGNIPVRIYDTDTIASLIVFIDVYGNGYDKDPTLTGQTATLTSGREIITPYDTMASLVDGKYVIDFSQTTYVAKATSDSDKDGNYNADLIDTVTGTVFKSVKVKNVTGARVRTGNTSVATNKDDTWYTQPGVDGLIPVEVITNSNDSNCVVNVYELGFDKDPTDESVIASIGLNTYFKDTDVPFKTFAQRVDGNYTITAKSKTTYFATATSDSNTNGTFNANLIDLDLGTVYKSITGIQIVDNKGFVKTGSKVIVTKSGSKWYCIPAQAQTVAGGTSDSIIVDGTVSTKVGKVGDVIKISDDNKAALNLANAAIVAGTGGNALPLSGLFQIVGGQLCIKTGALFTDGTNVGPFGFKFDNGTWRPELTFVS